MTIGKGIKELRYIFIDIYTHLCIGYKSISISYSQNGQNPVKTTKD